MGYLVGRHSGDRDETKFCRDVISTPLRSSKYKERESKDIPHTAPLPSTWLKLTTWLDLIKTWLTTWIGVDHNKLKRHSPLTTPGGEPERRGPRPPSLRSANRGGGGFIYGIEYPSSTLRAPGHSLFWWFVKKNLFSLCYRKTERGTDSFLPCGGSEWGLCCQLMDFFPFGTRSNFGL